MIELALIILNVLIAYLAFPGDQIVRGLFVIRLFLVIALQFANLLWIHPFSNGLSPVYNDEMYFAEILRFSHFSWFDIAKSFSSGGTAHAYPAFISALKPYCIDVLFAGKLLNNLCILLLASFAHRTGASIGLRRNYNQALAGLIAVSPSLVFFSSMFLRDTLIVFAVTGFCCAFVTGRYLIMLAFLAFCFFLRQHLGLSLIYGVGCTFLMRFTPSRFAKIALPFALFYLLAIFKFPFVGALLNFNRSFVLSYFLNMMGLQFLFGEEASMALPWMDVILRRFLAPDTFVLQIGLLGFLIHRLLRGKRELPLLCALFLSANIPYIFSYEVVGFAAARQVVIPFLPVVYMQLLLLWQAWRDSRSPLRSVPPPVESSIRQPLASA